MSETTNNCKVFGKSKFCKEDKKFETCILCILGLIEKHLYTIQKSMNDKDKKKGDK